MEGAAGEAVEGEAVEREAKMGVAGVRGQLTWRQCRAGNG